MATFLRRIVSQNKRRYCRDGFDLDLAFINAGPEFQGRLIAMAYPSQGLEALYRNNFKDVKRFLQEQALQRGAAYKVYNLSMEKPGYTTERLGGSLAQFCFPDHQVPTLAMMWAFCEDLERFLNEHPANFAAVHCKAGKGRTGIMICAYLLFKGLATSAEEAMQIYAQQRSADSVALTVESQKRWVRYFDASIRGGGISQSQPLTLQSLTISGLPKHQLKALVICAAVRSPTTGEIQEIGEISGKASDVPTKATLDSDRLSIEFTPLPSGSTSSGNVEELKLDGDVRIEVYKHKVGPTRLMCRTWLSTAYISPGQLSLASNELDKGYSRVPESLQIRMLFGEAHRTPLSCTVSASCSELESLPIGSPAASRGPPGRMLESLGLSQEYSCSTSLPSQAVTPHILDIHPDFSIPARYFTVAQPAVPSLAIGYGQGVLRNPFLAAVQEGSYTPQESERSFKVDQQELSARLEHLAELQSKDMDPELEESSPFMNASVNLDMHRSARSDRQGAMSSWRSGGSALKNAFSGNFKRVRWPDANREDPELQDRSAPTTPSLPRHPGSLDWQASPDTSICPYLLDLRSSQMRASSSGYQSSAALHQSFEGLETPSHAAQMIKWMSSSWWLTMA